MRFIYAGGMVAQRSWVAPAFLRRFPSDVLRVVFVLAGVAGLLPLEIVEDECGRWALAGRFRVRTRAAVRTDFTYAARPGSFDARGPAMFRVLTRWARRNRLMAAGAESPKVTGDTWRQGLPYLRAKVAVFRELPVGAGAKVNTMVASASRTFHSVRTR